MALAPQRSLETLLPCDMTICGAEGSSNLLSCFIMVGDDLVAPHPNTATMSNEIRIAQGIKYTLLIRIYSYLSENDVLTNYTKNDGIKKRKSPSSFLRHGAVITIHHLNWLHGAYSTNPISIPTYLFPDSR